MRLFATAALFCPFRKGQKVYNVIYNNIETAYRQPLFSPQKPTKKRRSPL
ncbi:hypothetical protein TGS27_0247 [Geobacillus stearothermophilus]|uniref:Uncharacterized protein n=1 Tax=Geobacillus stearothermophilus TaxID=1422 RepID=A0A150NAB4_GEOSE|nr:hypothetical protein GS8_2350 [Geobacillus stearothermophilus]KYD33578.1 hypothetical protein B4114_2124 [Geobacillus stearothermophilus]OAO88544.1 hypothetical protein TGS27_0247 [Geobacillus stearothermophilus]